MGGIWGSSVVGRFISLEGVEVNTASGWMVRGRDVESERAGSNWKILGCKKEKKRQREGISGNKAGAYNAQENNKQDREVLQSSSNLDLVEGYNVAGILQRQGCRLQGLEGKGPHTRGAEGRGGKVLAGSVAGTGVQPSQPAHARLTPQRPKSRLVSGLRRQNG